MNIALEQTKEFVDGKMRRNYGDAFVRGNNGEFWVLFGVHDYRRCLTTGDADGEGQSCTFPPMLHELVTQHTFETEARFAIGATGSA